MINNPNMLEETLENFNKVPKEIIKESIKEVTMKDEEAIERMKDIANYINENSKYETYQGYYIRCRSEEAKMFETILNLIEKQRAEIKQKDLEITSLKMEHDYDVKMIDEVKGEAVRLYKEIEILKRDFEIVDHECSRLEQEDIRKDKMINEMAKWLDEDDTSFGYGNLKEVNTQEKIIEYFENKIKESK